MATAGEAPIDEDAMVNVHDAKTHYSKLLERAHRGETIILAKGGQPYARMVPLDESGTKKKRRSGGQLAHLNLHVPDSFFFDPLPEEELRLWEGWGDQS